MTAVDDILASHHTGRWFVMGILNVTPDSFSDGGRFDEPKRAVAHAQAMIEEGADLLDVGAESTRPGSQRVPAGEQISRLAEVLPGVCDLAGRAGAVVSVDTTRSAVARFAMDCGAQIVNDVSAGREDADLPGLVADRRGALVLMHMPGEPATMQDDPRYDDVVAEVRDFLAGQLDALARDGLPKDRCVLDAGIGFGKRLEHNLALLTDGTRALRGLDRPVLVGPSRKRFIGELSAGVAGTAPTPEDRTGGTVAACLAARSAGASLFRVHDVGAVRQALLVADAIEQARE